MQRINATKNVLAAARQRRRRGRVRLRRRRRLGGRPALIAVGSVIGGQIGATVGRRLPAWALRGFIVVVGVAALTQFVVGR